MYYIVRCYTILYAAILYYNILYYTMIYYTISSNSVYTMGVPRVIRLVTVLLLARARADKLKRWSYNMFEKKGCPGCSAVKGGTTALQPQQHVFSKML